MLPHRPPPLKFIQRSQLGKNHENVDFSLNNRDYAAGRQSYGEADSVEQNCLFFLANPDINLA